MRKPFIRLLVAVLAVIGIGAGAAVHTVEAGAYSSLTSCNHTAAKWICVDVSAGTVTVKTSNSSQYGALATYSGATPTKGYIGYDLYECNYSSAAGGTTITGVPTPNSYNLPSQFVITSSGGLPYPGKITVDAAVANDIAWLANSQTGYLCMVVP